MMRHIYLDNVRFSKLKKLIEKGIKVLNKDGGHPIMLHIFIEGKKAPVQLFRYAKVQGIGGIEFIYTRKLPSPRDLERIYYRRSIATTITYYRQGETLDEMKEKFKDSSAIIYALTKENEADVKAKFAIRYKKAGYDNHLSCHFDSCLGNTLYYAKDGKTYFCPFHRNEETLLHGPEDNPFDNTESFKKLIIKQIDFRKACQKKRCPHYPLCLGGCPFGEEPCLFFERNNGEEPFNRSPSLLSNFQIEQDLKDFKY